MKNYTSALFGDNSKRKKEENPLYALFCLGKVPNTTTKQMLQANAVISNNVFNSTNASM